MHIVSAKETARQAIASMGIERAFYQTRDLASRFDGEKTAQARYLRRVHAFVAHERIGK